MGFLRQELQRQRSHRDLSTDHRGGVLRPQGFSTKWCRQNDRYKHVRRTTV